MSQQCQAERCTRVMAGNLGSMAGTLYAALVMHSYIMSLICCAVQARTPLAGTPSVTRV